MNFQENLKKYREAAGYSQAKEFSNTVGIAYTTYLTYENQGREPKYEVLCKIAQVLGVSVDDLVGYKITELDKYVQFCRGLGFYIDVSEYTVFVAINKQEDETFSIPKDDFIDLMNGITNSAEYKNHAYAVVLHALRDMTFDIYCQALKNVDNGKEPKTIVEKSVAMTPKEIREYLKNIYKRK